MREHSASKQLTPAILASAIAGSDSAFRLVTKLEPIGGQADKVFPPTYASDGRADKYAKETRVVDGQPLQTVLLDSVQSQANRLELALQQAYDDGALDLPMVQVDFPDELGEIGRITALEAPHRLADAILRDSYLDKTPWRQSEPGKRFARASIKDASCLLELCPTALLFGLWDSTGELGGAGTKFARALVSEVVGFGAAVGEKTASRLDPLAIEKKGVTVYEHATDGWTLDAAKAVQEKGSPKVLKTKDGSNDGSPSAINHGNILPSIDTTSGGVSIQYALQTTVLSLTRLRMLRFGPSASLEASRAARTYLAALGLAAIACGREQGWWFRSRCELTPVPDTARPLQLIRADGAKEDFTVPTAEHACQLVNDAAEAVRKHKLLPKKGYSLRLRPSDKLLQLVRLSRGMNKV